MKVLSGAICAILAVSQVVAFLEIVDDNSFSPPYDNYDAAGKRVVPQWEYGGSAFVNSNFIRLTPDRASKRGWLWNRKPIMEDKFSLTLRFRVSGQGKTLFGDGFALWITDQQYHVDGPVHGFTDKFKGIGIIFDTFKNTEAGHIHKDIALVVGDGQQATAGITQDSPGCDSNFRYHEERDDFDAAKSKTAVKLALQDNKLTVHIDYDNRGHFKNCISMYELPLPAGWHKNSYLGLTATTGQLADNHDILGLQFSPNDMPLPERLEAPPLPISAGSDQLDRAIQATAEAEVHKLQEKLTHLHHHLEHQLTAVEDHIKANLAKLKEQEDRNEARLNELAGNMHDMMTQVTAREVGRKVDEMETKLMKIMDTVYGRDLDSHVEKRVKESTASAGRWWFIIFAVLTAICGVGIYLVWTWIKQERKMHLM